MIRKVSAEDIAIRGNGTGLEYMCPTRHFVYIFFNPVFQVSTAKNEINLFNNHVLIVAPVTFAPAGAMTPSTEFLYYLLMCVKSADLSGKQYRPWSDAAICGILSGSILSAQASDPIIRVITVTIEMQIVDSVSCSILFYSRSDPSDVDFSGKFYHGQFTCAEKQGQYSL